MANFGQLLRGQPHSPDVNHCVIHFRLEGHREPCNELGPLSLVEHLVAFELVTFQFLLQGLSPQGHLHLHFCFKLFYYFILAYNCISLSICFVTDCNFNCFIMNKYTELN